MTKEKKSFWQEDHIVSWEDITLNNHLSITALNRFLLQAAINHAEHLGFGFTDTSKQDMSWVLLRINMQINRLPAWKEKFNVVTWPSHVKAITAFREFEVLGEQGEILCAATSEWSVINLKTRRPQRMNNLNDMSNFLSNKVSLNSPFFKLDPKLEFEEMFSVKVRYSDMDMNGHTNAGKYFDWLSDAIYEVSGANEVAFISFNYFHECLLGDKLAIEKSKNVPGFIRGFKTKENKLAFWAKVELK